VRQPAVGTAIAGFRRWFRRRPEARATESEKAVDDRQFVWLPARSVSLPLEAPERVGPKSLIPMSNHCLETSC
jgi:hypothetical protein